MENQINLKSINKLKENPSILTSLETNFEVPLEEKDPKSE